MQENRPPTGTIVIYRKVNHIISTTYPYLLPTSYAGSYIKIFAYCCVKYFDP